MKHKEKKLQELKKGRHFKELLAKKEGGGHEKTMSTVVCVKSGALTERALWND